MSKINFISNPQPTLGGLKEKSPPFFKGWVGGDFKLEDSTPSINLN